MIRFLIDEDMPRSTAQLLREAGFESFDVREIGLRGAKDDVIYRRAQKENCIIMEIWGLQVAYVIPWGVIKVLLSPGSPMRYPQTN